MDHSQKINGSPLRVKCSEEGGSAYSYHLSHIVNNAIKGFWERRGMEEPGYDSKIVYGKYGGVKKNERRQRK